ncbi:MAG TPA: ribosome maturation factor RimP [Gemmatimonadaceae bacterium]|nr:ribosome maturation factor RimP [Gemmatimonadaceae bacterium]
MNVGEVPHIFLFSWVVKSELEVVVESRLDELGFDLVDVRRGGSRSRPIVEIRIDRRDGEKVTVADCARVSRGLEEWFDAPGHTALLGDRYELQVSSPGMDRPLKTARDWQRFIGRRATVKSTALSGRKEVEIVGIEGTVVVVAEGEGAKRVEHRLPLATIQEARLAFSWNRSGVDG